MIKLLNFRVSDKKLVYTFIDSGRIHSVAFSPDSQYILIGSSDKSAKLLKISILTKSVLTSLDNLTWPQYELLEKIQEAVINQQRLQATKKEIKVFNDLDNDIKDALKLYIK